MTDFVYTFLASTKVFRPINMPILYKSYKEKATYDIVGKPTTSYIYVRHVVYDIIYDIVCDIVYDIVYYIVYDICRYNITEF